jgi:AmiR/NasT family two-component response regulator
MTRSLRIAVADDDPTMLRWYVRTLTAMGHEVCVCAADGMELVEKSEHARPDLIITDIRMPNLSGVEALAQLQNIPSIPVILVSGFHDEEDVERALEHPVLAYLVKPINQADLQITIALVERRFREFAALEDRKLIERAKGILMKRAGMNEPDAFHRLQKLSQQQNQKLVEVARAIVVAEEAFST